jgi:hypothetical protein
MADCPNCGTWNPDDKIVCWRCQTELPRPVDKKRSEPARFLGLPAWSWSIIIVMLLAIVLAQCLFLPPVPAQ